MPLDRARERDRVLTTPRHRIERMFEYQARATNCGRAFLKASACAYTQSIAARILADVGDVARFADRNRFASWTGTAPLDASSGEQIRHRLSRAGNRHINRVLHTMARVQLRNLSEGRDYYERKKADGKAPMEAMRCVKRRLSDIVYQQMLNDAMRQATGPGGQQGHDSDSSATGSHPHTGS